MSYDFSPGVIAGYFDVLLAGLLTTIEFTLICIVLGSLLGFALSLMRVGRARPLRIVGTAQVARDVLGRDQHHQPRKDRRSSRRVPVARSSA